MSRIVKLSSLLVAVLLLAGCGFHLRQSVALPASMQRMHLSVNSRGDLQRNLARRKQSCHFAVGHWLR